MSEDAALYCFDTFSGFFEASVREEAQATGLVVSAGTFSDTSRAREAETIAGQPSPPRLFLRQGEFPATFAGPGTPHVALRVARRGPLRADQGWT